MFHYKQKEGTSTKPTWVCVTRSWEHRTLSRKMAISGLKVCWHWAGVNRITSVRPHTAWPFPAFCGCLRWTHWVLLDTHHGSNVSPVTCCTVRLPCLITPACFQNSKDLATSLNSLWVDGTCDPNCVNEPPALSPYLHHPQSWSHRCRSGEWLGQGNCPRPSSPNETHIPQSWTWAWRAYGSDYCIKYFKIHLCFTIQRN